VYETYWEVLCHFHICGQTTVWRNRGVKQMSWASHHFHDINEKSSPVISLAPCTNKEIVDRISTSTSSYTTESNEDTFKKVFTIRPGPGSIGGLPHVMVEALYGTNVAALSD